MSNKNVLLFLADSTLFITSLFLVCQNEAFERGLKALLLIFGVLWHSSFFDSRKPSTAANLDALASRFLGLMLSRTRTRARAKAKARARTSLGMGKQTFT